ncbi:seven-hairpin glycosidase [Hortaea werneckii]|nr:seven-hairpin glycosidase [Hortaea werneckii]KAI7100936.1 seven-hairpin glycosidase [Hortaea werneckii]KAI7236049.1 seven-hairpin glycosidase [Hortaea werneckii]KAI7328682.1 seven-hairpin glycosidase [Hortaea werneckii]KAI7381195.1 seven-hairpin glycosidase [Hortaea werneckii]
MRWSPRRLNVFLSSTLICIFLFVYLQASSNGLPSRSHGRTASQKDRICNCAGTREQYPEASPRSVPSPEKWRLPRTQHNFGFWSGRAQLERRAKVKAAFLRCWEAYREHAWMADELMPISGQSRAHFGGWAATLVDSLDTLWIMDLKDEFYDAVSAVMDIDFRSPGTAGTISVFETTIRYLGGLLAAYDLSADERLLEKAVKLGDTLYGAFDTPNRMPVTHLNVQAARDGMRQQADMSAVVAEIGSLSLEFTRLSQLTGECKYYSAIARIMDEFAQQQNLSTIPGMWPVSVNAFHKDFHTGTSFPLGAMADSLYEYLPKMHALLGGAKMYEEMYAYAVDTIIQHAIFRPMLPDGSLVLMAGKLESFGLAGSVPTLKPDVEHLGCFAGGMLALGGRLLRNVTHIQIGQGLAVGCYWAYAATPSGVMPEDFSVVPCSNWTTCGWDEALYQEHIRRHVEFQPGQTVNSVDDLPVGFTAITNRHYILRPEAIESLFILYRITGDESLRGLAWNMFESIQNATQTELANAAFSDVTDTTAPKMDEMESFWLAETLKYFYLIFGESSLIDLDEYVLNTEAHPLRRAKGSFLHWGLR